MWLGRQSKWCLQQLLSIQSNLHVSIEAIYVFQGYMCFNTNLAGVREYANESNGQDRTLRHNILVLSTHLWMPRTYLQTPSLHELCGQRAAGEQVKTKPNLGFNLDTLQIIQFWLAIFLHSPQYRRNPCLTQSASRMQFWSRLKQQYFLSLLFEEHWRMPSLSRYSTITLLSTPRISQIQTRLFFCSKASVSLGVWWDTVQQISSFHAHSMTR